MPTKWPSVLVVVCVVLFQCAHGFERRGGDDIEGEDIKSCVNQLFAECQTSMMMLITAEDKAAAADDMRQCISTNIQTHDVFVGLESDCDSIVSPEGTLTPEMQAAIQTCSTQALSACPIQMLQLSSVAIQIGNSIVREQNATKVQQAIQGLDWNSALTKFKAALTCLKQKSTQLSQTCPLLSADMVSDMGDAMEDMGFPDRDSSKSGHGSKPSKAAGGDSGGGLVFVGMVCFAIALAAGGLTYLIMRRRQQAQLLHGQLQGQQPQASAAAVIVTNAATQPTYDPVPVKSPINNV